MNTIRTSPIRPSEAHLTARRGPISRRYTHLAVCSVRHTDLLPETPRRCRSRGLHHRDLIATGTARHPPYRKQGVGARDRRRDIDARIVMAPDRAGSATHASHGNPRDAVATARASAAKGWTARSPGIYQIQYLSLTNKPPVQSLIFLL